MRVYTIIRISTSEVAYVGSTHQRLYDRKAKHHYNYNNKPQPVHHMMRNNGGWEAYDFKTYSEHPGVTRQELRIIEQGVIHHLKPSYNTYNSYQSEEDKKEYNRGYAAKRRADGTDISRQRFICECGSDIRWGDKLRHTRSDKHQEFLKQTLPPQNSE